MRAKNAVTKHYLSNSVRIQQRHKKGKDLKADELLSGFSSIDRLVPVISLVIYWSNHPWDGPKTLHEMLDISGNISQYKDKFVEKNESIFRQVDTETVQAIQVLTNSKELSLVLPAKSEEDGEVIDMCKALQDLISDSRKEGEILGLEQGVRALIRDNLEENKSKEIIIDKLIRIFSLEKEKATAYYNKYAVK